MARPARRTAHGQLSFGEVLAPARAPSGPELLVLPDAPRVEAWLLARAEQGGLALAGSVCTVSELERALLSAARLPLLEASPLAQELACRKAAREQTPRGSPWFAVRETPGFARALRALAHTLGQARLSPSELLALLENADAGPPGGGARANDANRAGRPGESSPETASPISDGRGLRRLIPLARLLEGARRELEQAGAADRATSLRAALGADAPLPPILRGIGALRFEAVLDWPPLRLELLFALASRLGREGVPVRLALPFWPDRRALAEEPLGPVLRAIEARGAQGGDAPELILAPIGDQGALGPFRRRLFAPGQSATLGLHDDGDLSSPVASPEGEPLPEPEARSPRPALQVSLASCSSPAAEAREAARRARELIDAGAAPERIAIAVRELAGAQAAELIAALERLEVPWRERRGRPALTAPPVQLALSLYALLEGNFAREPLLALLSSRQLWLRERDERASPQALARWLSRARVRDDAVDGGVAAQLDRLVARMRHAAEAAEEARRPQLERELAEAEETRARTLRLLDEVRALPAEATLRAHGQALLGLLERWGLRARAEREPRALGLPRGSATSPSAILAERAEGGAGEEREPEGEAAGASPLERASAAARQRSLAGIAALEAACRDLAFAAREAGQSERTFPRESFAELLSSALEGGSLRPGGARGAAVELVALHELAGRQLDHLIVAGLVEGQLPARPAIDPLLSDDEKRALNRAAGRPVFRSALRRGGADEPAEAGEPSLPARQSEEPLWFQLALAAARESILLLWPRADSRGRETPRSTFADEAARALGLSPGDGEPLDRPQPGRIARLPLSAIPPLPACRSDDELLARASLDAIADPAFRALAPAPREESRALLASLARSHLRGALEQAARASLAERERLQAFIGAIPPGRFSGQLSGAALEAVRPLFAFGPDAPLSARQLEQDATCAFRTFGQRVLHLEEPAEIEDDLSARERGTLLHRCLERFYATERDAHRLPLREPRAAWAARLRALASAEMEQFARAQDTGHGALWRLRREETLALLEEVVAAEAELDASPLELERTFGFPSEQSWPALRIPAPEGDGAVFVRGAIDRLDRLPAGEGGGTLVIDYKSSRLANLSRKLKAESLFAPEFQLLLYIAAARARQPGPADALYLSLRDASRSPRLSQSLAKAGLSLDALTELEPSRRAALRAQAEVQARAAAPAHARAGDETPAPNLADEIWRRVSRLRAGTLPVEPLDCDRCSLKPVCRIAALPVDEEELR